MHTKWIWGGQLQHSELSLLGFWASCGHGKMPRYYCDYCDAYLTHDSVSSLLVSPSLAVVQVLIVQQSLTSNVLDSLSLQPSVRKQHNAGFKHKVWLFWIACCSIHAVVCFNVVHYVRNELLGVRVCLVLVASRKPEIWEGLLAHRSMPAKTDVPSFIWSKYT